MTQLLTTDVELCRACRTGQRDAFRRVVERYQGLVTSITYNATGDIPISEDLAQDTFLLAWRKIGSLREPEKLAGWLCAIARNRVRDWLRRRKNDVDRRAVALLDTMPASATEPLPDTRMEREEESALVWHAIESIPNDYREVLVLHYREQIETSQIAGALGITEAAARQRLSRARAMVRQELAGVVERGLRRTSPSQAFTVAVMAALPALTPTAATAAVGGGLVAKSSGALISTGVMLIGPVLGLLGGIYGTRLSIKHTDSATERRFMVRYAWAVWLLIIVFLSSLTLATIYSREHLGTAGYFVALSAIVLIYIGVLIPTVLWGNKRQRAIRREQGSPDLRLVMRRAWSRPGGIYGGLAAAVLGSMGWMVVFAVMAGDWLTAALVTAASLGVVLLGAALMKRYGVKATRAVLCGVTGVMCGVNALVLDTRLHAWIAQLDDRPIADVKADLPSWAMTLLTVCVFVVVMAVVNLSLVSNRRDGIN